MAGTKACSARIGDHALAFGMKAFEHKPYEKDAETIWVWYVSKYCSGEPLAQAVGVTLSDLITMKQTIERHIEVIQERAAQAGPSNGNYILDSRNGLG